MRIEPKAAPDPETRDGKPAEGMSAASQLEPRAARLSEIRALIQRGEYPIDLDKLAAKIVDDDIARSCE